MTLNEALKRLSETSGLHGDNLVEYINIHYHALPQDYRMSHLDDPIEVIVAQYEIDSNTEQVSNIDDTEDSKSTEDTVSQVKNVLTGNKQEKEDKPRQARTTLLFTCDDVNKPIGIYYKKYVIFFNDKSTIPDELVGKSIERKGFKLDFNEGKSVDITRSDS